MRFPARLVKTLWFGLLFIAPMAARAATVYNLTTDWSDAANPSAA